AGAGLHSQDFSYSTVRFGCVSGMIGAPQRLPDMQRRVLTLTSAVSLVLVTVVHADDLVLDRFGSYLESLRTQAAIPGLAASIIGPGYVMREFVFGRQNVERADPVKPIPPFHLDGVTQIVTATLGLRCAGENRLWLH